MKGMGKKVNFHKNPKTRDYTIISSNGRRIHGKKRSFPENFSCEVCGHKPFKKLDYHHWDDTKPIKGMWVCGFCHKGIHKYEDGGVFRQSDRFSWAIHLNAYLKLKNDIDNGIGLITEARELELSSFQKIMKTAIAKQTGD